MPDQSQKFKKVLFVDDNVQFLEMIQLERRVMGEWSRGEWEIFLAQNSDGKALLLLQEHAIDLVVVDIQMPVVDGVQFLALLHRKYPDIQKVTLSAYADDASRTACMNHGAELFLEKPRNPGDLEIIFSTLRELARQEHVATGFRGVLRQVSLEDVIQMECLNKNSSILEVAAANWQGKIYVLDGAIIHAEAGDRNGEAALNRILLLKGGEFNLRPFAEPSQRSIDGPWEFLLHGSRSRPRRGCRDRAGAKPCSVEGLRSPPLKFPDEPFSFAMPKPAPPNVAPVLPPAPSVSASRRWPLERLPELTRSSSARPREKSCTNGNVPAPTNASAFLEFISQKIRATRRRTEPRPV